MITFKIHRSELDKGERGTATNFEFVKTEYLRSNKIKYCGSLKLIDEIIKDKHYLELL